MTQKPFYLSKTLWANALIYAAAHIPALKPYVTVESVASVVAAVNLVLRVVTQDKLTLS